MTLGIASIVGEVCGKSLIVSVCVASLLSFQFISKDGLQVSLRVGDLGSHVDHIPPKVRFRWRYGQKGKLGPMGFCPSPKLWIGPTFCIGSLGGSSFNKAYI